MFRPEALGSKANIRTGQSSDARLVISEAEDILSCAEKQKTKLLRHGDTIKLAFAVNPMEALAELAHTQRC